MNAHQNNTGSIETTGSALAALNEWVASVAMLTKPAAIHWCDGSDSENVALIAQMQADGTLIKLNEDTHPNSWLHRSHPDDVARVEHLTFVCTPERDDAGPNNHWMSPEDGHAQMDALFDGCMRGRTLYVILIAWARSIRRWRAAGWKSPTRPTWSPTCGS